MKTKTIFNSFVIVLILLVRTQGFGQQNPLYTEYYNNFSLINPAYSGSHRYFTATAYLKGPWIRKPEGVKTQSFSLHGATEKNFGVGFSIVHNNEDIFDEIRVFTDFSYSLEIDDYSTLALGIKTGASLTRIDLEQIGFLEDSLFKENINEFKPNFGVGVFYYTDNFYASLSVIDILKTTHYNLSTNIVSLAKKNRKLYVSAGYAYSLNSVIKLKPSFMVRSVNGESISTDLSANVLWYDQFEFGISHRFDSSFSGMMQIRLNDYLTVGYSINKVLRNSNEYKNDFHEFRISFDMNRFGDHSFKIKPPFYW